MAAIGFTFPVLPGMEEEARRFAREIMARRDEFAETQRRLGVTEESWYLQASPEGTVIVDYFEAEDVERVFRDFVASQSPFDRWFKQRFQEITGLDVSQVVTELASEQILDWRAS